MVRPSLVRSYVSGIRVTKNNKTHKHKILIPYGINHTFKREKDHLLCPLSNYLINQQGSFCLDIDWLSMSTKSRSWRCRVHILINEAIQKFVSGRFFNNQFPTALYLLDPSQSVIFPTAGTSYVFFVGNQLARNAKVRQIAAHLARQFSSTTKSAVSAPIIFFIDVHYSFRKLEAKYSTYLLYCFMDCKRIATGCHTTPHLNTLMT